MGNTFNTGRLINGLFVDANGNVGIGITTLTQKLNISGSIRLDDGNADGPQLVLASSGFSDWNIDNYSGTLRAYYGSTVRFSLTNAGAATFSSSVTALKYIANAQATYGTLTYEETFKYASSPAGIWFSNSFNSNNNVGLQLRTSNDGTSVQAMTLTPAGNVGIGTSSPGAKLHISGNTSSQIISVIENFDATTSGGTRLSFRYQGTETAYIYNRFNGADFNTDIGSTDYMRFLTGATERMRITSGGNVGIGTTSFPSSDYKFVVKQGTNRNIAIATQGSELSIEAYNDAATSSVPLRFYSSVFSFRNGQVQLWQSGNSFSDGLRLYNTSFNNWGIVSGGDNNLYFGYNSNSSSRIETSGAYVQLSDINKKKDFEESTIGLIAILGLKPTLFRMKTDDESSEKQLGFIAQEVKDCIPQAYSQSDEFIGLNYNPIVAALVKAIQELNAKVTALENK